MWQVVIPDIFIKTTRKREVVFLFWVHWLADFYAIPHDYSDVNYRLNPKKLIESPLLMKTHPKQGT